MATEKKSLPGQMVLLDQMILYFELLFLLNYAIDWKNNELSIFYVTLNKSFQDVF